MLNSTNDSTMDRGTLRAIQSNLRRRHSINYCETIRRPMSQAQETSQLLPPSPQPHDLTRFTQSCTSSRLSGGVKRPAPAVETVSAPSGQPPRKRARRQSAPPCPRTAASPYSLATYLPSNSMSEEIVSVREEQRNGGNKKHGAIKMTLPRPQPRLPPSPTKQASLPCSTTAASPYSLATYLPSKYRTQDTAEEMVSVREEQRNGENIRHGAIQ